MPGNNAGTVGNILLSQGPGVAPVWLPNGAVGSVLLIGPGGTPVWAPNPICTSPTLNRFIKFSSTTPTTVCNTTLAENNNNQIWNTDGGGPTYNTTKLEITATGTFPYAISGLATTGGGVYGEATTGNAVWGSATGTGSRGVFGMATGANGFGVYGYVSQTTGIGVYGYNSTNSPAVVGLNSGATTYYSNTAGSFGGPQTGVTAWSTNPSGTGISAAGNGLTPAILTSGSGGAFTGSGTGSVSWAISATGTGVLGAGNNQTASYLTDGSGGAFTGSSFGVFGYAATNNNNTWGAYFANAAGDFVYVGGRTAGGTSRKVEGAGTVNTVVTSVTGEKVVLSAPEAPENLFMDFGVGRLENGHAYVRLDPNFSKNIVVNEKHPLRVFITLGGDCKGVYVTNTSSEGFEVRELQGGTSNVAFYWQVVANRADEYDAQGRRIPYSEERFAPATPPPAVIEAKAVPIKEVVTANPIQVPVKERTVRSPEK